MQSHSARNYGIFFFYYYYAQGIATETIAAVTPLVEDLSERE